jgi:leader peptidase (prepilin peptidase) / N-methyltransferase
MLIVIWLAVAGLCLGSFVNALMWRLRQQELLAEKKPKARDQKAEKPKAKKRILKAEDLSILKGRSMCSHCHHPLAAKDLIPVVSWLWLRGRCRYCHHKIEDSPVAELLVPTLFILSYLFWPNGLHDWGTVQFWFWLVFVVGFVALMLYDLHWYILPDRIVYPLIALAVLEVLIHVAFFSGDWQAFLTAICGVAIASGIFYVLFQISRGAWIGGGDVKLGIVLGLLLGGPLPSLFLLFLASTLGSLVSLPLLMTGKVKRDTLIPFGPFLLAATCIVVLFGSHFTRWLNSLVLR